MSILCTTRSVVETSYTYTITTGTTPYTDPYSGTYYKGTNTVDYGDEVRYIKFTSSTSAGYDISGTKVTYTVTENTSQKSRTFTVVVGTGPAPTNITDVKTTSGSIVNYVKVSPDNKYVWARPATLSLQLPWDYYKSWTLSRESGSLGPASTTGTITSSSSLSTSGTNTYSISGLYYGDKIKITYTAKPGATSFGIASGSTYTIDPTFSISNTNASSIGLNAPTLTLSDKFGWKEVSWDTVKNTSNPEQFTATVTNNASVACDVYFMDDSVGYAEAYYRVNLNLVTYTDTRCTIATSGGTKISSSSYTYVGTIAAGETKNFTFKLVPSVSVTKCWPKHAGLSVKLVASGSHKYSPDYNTDYEYGGQWTMGGDVGGGPSYGTGW